MRADPDFTAYVDARWTPVVRMLVLLGLPARRAEETAVAAFARMLPDWRRLTREGDLDVELARVVLARWVRARSAEPAPRPAVLVPTAAALTPELEDQLALLEELMGGLARLDESTRVTVVLHHLGELDPAQLAETLGEPPAELERSLAAARSALGLGALDGVFRSASAAIAVPPASVSRVVAKADATRRRQWLVTGAVLLVLVAVAGGAFALTRPEPPATLESLTITPVENPVNLAWWADGVLHLDHGTARVPDVRQLVEAGPRVVYGTAAGAVVAVSEDGSPHPTGHHGPGDAAGRRQPASAWSGGSSPVAMWWSMTCSRSARPAGPKGKGENRTVGFDRGELYFSSDGTDQSVTTNSGRTVVSPVAPPEAAADSRLVDISSGTELRIGGGGLTVTQPLFSLTTDLPGDRGRLSVDGNFAITAGTDNLPLVSDTRDGADQGTWFSEEVDACRGCVQPPGAGRLGRRRRGRDPGTLLVCGGQGLRRLLPPRQRAVHSGLRPDGHRARAGGRRDRCPH